MRRGEALIKRPTVTGSVADVLRKRILNGEFAGGDLIRQEALAAQLGVSRIPVREALLQLEAEGLVVIHTHRGAEVARLTEDDARDLFEARLMIEPVVIEQAVANLCECDVARIAEALGEYEQAISVKAKPEELSRLNWDFHASLCRPARRPRLLAILQMLHTGTDRYLRMQIATPAAKKRALADHRSLYQAFQKRSSELAAKQMRAHIQDAYDDVIRGLAARAGPMLPAG